MSTNLKKKSSKLEKKEKKKTVPGQILGEDWPDKNSAKCYEAARLRVLDRHRSTKPTTAPRNLNGVRSLGAPTYPLVTECSVHKTAGDAWRALARRLIQTHLDAAV